MGCHCLLRGNFLTQGLNPDLLHCRQTLYRLSHKGSAMEHYSALKRTEILSQAAATQVSLEDIMVSRISQSSRDKTLPDSLVAQIVKVSAYSVGNWGSILGSGRSSGEGNGKPLQYSCLENPVDGRAW